MKKQLISFVNQTAKSFDESQQAYVEKGLLRAVCDNLEWNITSKRQKIGEVEAELRNRLDPTKLPHNEVEEIAAHTSVPVEEVLLTRNAKSIEFLDSLYQNMDIYTRLFEEAKEAFREKTGETYTRRRASTNATTSDAMKRMRARLGI